MRTKYKQKIVDGAVLIVVAVAMILSAGCGPTKVVYVQPKPNSENTAAINYLTQQIHVLQLKINALQVSDETDNEELQAQLGVLAADIGELEALVEQISVKEPKKERAL